MILDSGSDAHLETIRGSTVLAPGNRSNDTHEIWQQAHYIEENLKTTGETRPGEIERGEREKERREKRGRRKEDGWTMDYNLVPS
ncbi:hypothetical protein TNIN_377671 [Trichonephila inaurata madagascariensis]|uniref:Uncharacterized protein n=1 Tax=Trichonephila inaurata madagascariensis TaxID=2747483 RepID=A0A8X6YEL9_9ARAC|nr:hypothetical protein TNIN_377671 [Trichonephila inaurata madagascariensis]